MISRPYHTKPIAKVSHFSQAIDLCRMGKDLARAEDKGPALAVYRQALEHFNESSHPHKAHFRGLVERAIAFLEGFELGFRSGRSARIFEAEIVNALDMEG